MSIILALDLATVSGFAYFKPGMTRPRYGRWTFPTDVGEETERVTLALRRKMRDYHALESFEGGTVVIERAIKKPTDTTRTLEILLGLAMEAATTARDLGAVPRVVDNAAMFKFWVGIHHFDADSSEERRKLRKAYSMKAALAKGWTPKNHDTADALGLLCYYCNLWNVEVPWENRPSPGPAYLDLKLKGVVVE